MSSQIPEEVDKGIALYESGDSEAAKSHWRNLLRNEDLAAFAVECISLVDEAGDEFIDLRVALSAEEDDDLGWGDLLDNVGDLSGFGVPEQDVDLDELDPDGAGLVFDDPLEYQTREQSDGLEDMPRDDPGSDDEEDDPLARLSLLKDLPPEADGSADDDILGQHFMVDDNGEPVDDLFADLTNEDLKAREPSSSGYLESQGSSDNDDPLADDPLADDPLADDPLTDDPLGPDPLADVSLGRSIPTDGNSSLLPELHGGSTSTRPSRSAREPVSDEHAAPGSPNDFASHTEQTGKRETDSSATPSPANAQQRSDPLAHFFEEEVEEPEESKNDETNPQTPSSRAPVKGLDKLLQQDSPEDSDVSIGPQSAPPPLTAPSPKHQAAASSDGFFGSFFGEQPEEEEDSTPGETPGSLDDLDLSEQLSRPRPQELAVDRPVSPFELDLLPPDEEDELDDLDALQQLFDEASDLVDSTATEDEERVRPMPGALSRPSTPPGTPRPVDLERSRLGETDSPTPSKPLASEAFNRELTPAHGSGNFDRTETGDLPNAAGYSECQRLLEEGEAFKAWARATELQKDDDSPELAELAAALHERLLGMAVELIKPLDRTPVLAVAPSEITQLPGLDHRAGYLLSQIDGTVPIEFLIDLGAMPREEAALVILTLEERGIIDV